MNPIRTVLVLIVLATTRAIAAEADPAAIREIRNIAVISVLSDAIEVTYLDLLWNTEYTGPVDGWKINAHTRRVLAELVSRRDRFQLKHVQYDEKALWDAYRKEGTGAGAKLRASLGGTPGVTALKAALGELATAHSVDAFVLVLPGGPSGPLCAGAGTRCSSGYGNTGMGVFTDRPIPGTGPRYGSQAYISINLYFVLAKDATVLADTSVAAHRGFGSVPMREFAAIPPAGLAQLEQLIKAFISAELPEAVLRLGILNHPIERIEAKPQTPFPSLVVNVECCRDHRSIGPNITKAYDKALDAGLFARAPESAVLTVKRMTWLMHPMAGRRLDQIQGVLALRGNEYPVQEPATMTSDIELTSASMGETVFNKIRSLLFIESR